MKNTEHNDNNGNDAQNADDAVLYAMLSEHLAASEDRGPGTNTNNDPDIGTQETATASTASGKRPTKRRKVNRISASEQRQSTQVGLNAALEKRAMQTKKPARRRSAKKASEEGSNPRPRNRGKRSKKTPNDVNLNDMLHANVLENARVNATLPAIPELTEKDKHKALAQLLASIPTKDQKEALNDSKAILAATRKFTNKARSDGVSGWKIKGLKSTLLHHQVSMDLESALCIEWADNDSAAWGCFHGR